MGIGYMDIRERYIWIARREVSQKSLGIRNVLLRRPSRAIPKKASTPRSVTFVAVTLVIGGSCYTCSGNKS